MQSQVNGNQGFVPLRLCRDPSISPIAKTVFALLTTYVGGPFPNQKQLAALVPCSVPTLIAALKELEKEGWIVTVPGNRRRGETNSYCIKAE